MPLTTKAVAAEVASKLRQAIESHVFREGRSVTITIGVAGNPDDNAYTYEDMLKKADDALYAGKQLQRNSVYVYGGEVKTPSKKAESKSCKSQKEEAPVSSGQGGQNMYDNGPF